MPLQSVSFADPSRLDAQVAPASGHTCLMRGKECDIQHPCAIRMLLLSAVIRYSALALSMHYQR